MILHFVDPVDGVDKTFEVYTADEGCVCVGVYTGHWNQAEVDVLGEGEGLEAHVALRLVDWATLLAAVNKEAKQ